MRVSLILVFFLLFISIETSYAQPFLKNINENPKSFIELQRLFDSWKKNVDISKEHGWKYFKRWEMETQMHTDAHGSPVDPESYVDIVTKTAADKQSSITSRFATPSWVPEGPNVLPNNLTGYMENGVGRINCIAFHPTDPATYFVGVAQGGVWKTSNNGVSWTPLTDNLPITRISDIAIDPINPDIMYISVCDFEYISFSLLLNGKKRNTHYGLGVYKTIDGGITWNTTGLSFQLTDGLASLVRKILINPNNTNELVACGVNGMYKSLDAGLTWNKKVNELFWDLTIDPNNQNILYAATGWVQTANIGNAGIYKSTNFGSTWTLLNTNIPLVDSVQRIKLAVAPSNSNYIYAVTVNTDNGFYGIYKSIDAGLTWQFLNNGINILNGNDGTGPGGQGNYDLGFSINASDENILYVGGVNLWESIDGGFVFDPVAHWTLSYGPTIHGDIHFIERQPLTGNLFVCSDGGLYRTSNVLSQSWLDANNGNPWPTQWTNLCNGLAITSFYRISSSRTTDGRLLAGAQDNASFFYDGLDWSTVNGGDGMDNYIDPLNSNYLIASSQYGNLASSFDGGVTFSGVFSNVNNELAEWTTPIVADYNQPGVLYAGYENVVMSNDNGSSWTSISSFPPSGIANNEISALAVSNSNSNYIYAAKRVRYEFSVPGSVYVTPDGGSSWNDITFGLPDSLYYTSIDVKANDENTAYVSMAGFSIGNKVFETNNAGNSWRNISYNLPNIPVNCVKNIPGSNKLMAATDIGIYILDSNSTIWTNQSVGLPNVIIQDIEFNAALDKVYLATFGRGIWSTNISVLTSLNEKSANELEVELTPSINDGSFNINILNKKLLAETFALEIIDIKGQLVYSEILKGNNHYHQNLNLQSGMYFAKLKSDKHSGVKRFVVE